MNDRFKTRGIHPVLGELQEIRYIDFIHNTVDFGDGDIFKIEEVNMQQCTGLKDKNGKLIYEGDIVKFKDQIKINGSKTHISAVEFNEQFNTYMYHAECMGLYTINKAQNEQFDVEVIGNIYENKDLLNA